ncbi:MAG: hypothetical protein WC645_08295, partial [Candidatus Margulisiibacteriota bacterium]
FLRLYPTAEVPTPPTLKAEPTDDPYLGGREEQEFYDLVFKNGARLRIYADGSQQPIGELYEYPLAVLMVPGTQRHQHVARKIQNDGAHEIFGGGVYLDPDLAQILAQGKVPHPFGGYFTGYIEESLFSVFGNDRKQNLWQALIDAGYIEPDKKGGEEGSVLQKFTGKESDFVLPIALKDEEKKKILTLISDQVRYTMPRWHFMYPTEYASISDADQMDLVVTNLRLHHTRKNPHLRVMMLRPRVELLPFSRDMMEEEYDSFLEVGVAVVWMVLKVKLINGKELFIPLNKNKENERTFGSELWRYIDESRPVKIVEERGRSFLQIPYRLDATKDPAFRSAINYRLMGEGKYNNREPIELIPIPLEMRDLVGQIEEIRINPERYSEVGGPRPVADYFFLRRNEDGMVTDKSRTLRMTDKTANTLIFGKVALLSHSEVKHWETVMENENESPKENLPWTDKNGWVHMKMSEAEAQMLSAWLPEYFGKEVPYYDDQNGEFIVYVKHFELLCEHAYDEFTYRRFMPDYEYRTYFDPAEADLDYPEEAQNNES